MGSAGIKASIEQGKVTIKEDSVVVKAGNVISGKTADVLSKLGIKPIELGLNLVATYENGQVFKKEVLDVDEKYYLGVLRLAASEAMNLSVNAGYVTEENIELFLRKAESEARVIVKIAYAERDKIIKAISSVEKEAEKISDLVQSENENNNQEGGT